jgi:hypothetical protein
LIPLAGSARSTGRQPRESLARISARFVKKRDFASPADVLDGKISLPVDCYAPPDAAMNFESEIDCVRSFDVAHTDCACCVTI